jgi:hypothetical protein
VRNLWMKHQYLLLALGGIALLALSITGPSGERWLNTIQAALGGFLLCQAIYAKWLNDYSSWLDEAHGYNERLIRIIDGRRAGSEGLN